MEGMRLVVGVRASGKSTVADRFPGDPPVKLELDHVVLDHVLAQHFVEYLHLEDVADPGQDRSILVSPQHAGTVDGGVVGRPAQLAERHVGGSVYVPRDRYGRFMRGHDR